MRSLASFALCRDGGKISLDSLRHSSAKPLLALAGIAQPEAFFSMLRALELPLKRTIAFSDHYAFDSFSRNEYGGYTIICTEKDALKLWSHVPDALAIPLEMVVEQAMLVEFETHLSALLEARLSSSHGHQTT